MANLSRKKTKNIGFRCSDTLFDVFDELKLTGGGMRPKDFSSLSKIDWINLALSQMFSRFLSRNNICDKQVNSCESVDDVYKLFLQWSRADRGIEGYGFSAKDRKTRFVYGPGATE